MEAEAVKEKVELLQAQLGKNQRDRDIIQSELDAMSDKYEKAATQSQKLIVSNFNNLVAIVFACKSKVV